MKGVFLPIFLLTSLFAGFFSGVPPAAAETESVPPPHQQTVGDSMRGKDLFTGSSPLQAGGPPCMACHSVSGIGALGGGALGPDLTDAFQKFGEPVLGMMLTSPPPTMKPIFDKTPLTPEERAHIVAFLRGASVTERPINTVVLLIILATGGTVILFVLMNFKWRRRLMGVRRPMIQTSQGGN